MARRILGSAFVAPPRSVSGREGAPEELFEAMARGKRAPLLLTPHSLFPGERVRQRNDLKPCRGAFWASLC